MTLRPELLDSCMEEARKELKDRKRLEENLLRYNSNRTSRTPSSYHHKITILSPEVVNASDSAVVAEQSVRLILAREEGASIEDLKTAENVGLLVEQWEHCKQIETKRCKADEPFRSLDGSCNNLRSPLSGSTNQPFRRILPPVYDDRFSSPRTKSFLDGQPLPLAREVSRRFTDSAASAVVEPKLSIYFLTWGQFIDHDLTNTGSTKGKIIVNILNQSNKKGSLMSGVNGSAITCCDLCDQCEMHPQCFPIRVDPSDPFYASKGVRCMDFIRSAPAPQCHIGEFNLFMCLKRKMCLFKRVVYHYKVAVSNLTRPLLISTDP